MNGPAFARLLASLPEFSFDYVWAKAETLDKVARLYEQAMAAEAGPFLSVVGGNRSHERKQMSESDPTERPWIVERVEYPRHLDVSFEVRSGETVICQTYMRDIKSEAFLIAIDEANLELIVRAVNAHDDLVAELRNIANADPSQWEPDVRDQFREWAQSRARAAVAKAEPKA